MANIKQFWENHKKTIVASTIIIIALALLFMNYFIPQVFVSQLISPCSGETILLGNGTCVSLQSIRFRGGGGGGETALKPGAAAGESGEVQFNVGDVLTADGNLH